MSCDSESTDRIARAVLERAISDRRNTDPLCRRNTMDAERWFLLKDQTYVFSFVNICRRLNLDPVEVERKTRPGGNSR